MYDNYEIVKESNGSFSSILDCNGMKAYNCKLECELDGMMATLQDAYDNGFADGQKDQKEYIRGILGL